MFFYTLIHIQQRIVLLTNIRTWITYGNCVEIILSVIRNGIQKMTKWASLELNEKFYPEHVWLFFLYHYHYSSRKHNKLFCFVIYEFNKMSLKKTDDTKKVHGKIYITITNVLSPRILKYSIALEVASFFAWNDKAFYK